MIDMDISTAASVASGWAAAAGSLLWSKWRSKSAKQKGKLLENLADALEDGSIDINEATNLVQSFWYTQYTQEGQKNE